jgi:hypothetical protein
VLIRVLPALLAPLLVVAGVQLLPPRSAGVPLLPDLEQEVPADLIVTHARGEYRLGFRSAVRNVGAGPLVISGHRRDRAVDDMRADQLITEQGASKRLLRDVGRLRYVVSPDHRHWHLLGFERYELARPGGRALVTDRKTGFCLGDRYRAPGTAPEMPKLYTSRCGLGQPAVLGVSEGISVGFGDAYAANLEGQYVPLRGLRAGRYVLIHRVNVNRRLRELRYDNNAASVVLDLRWRAGVPRLRLVAQCPDSARCG